MDSIFLTIAEASKKTGRSASTIRRMVHAIIEQAKHPDRSAVIPSISDVQALKKKGENFTWKIREDVVMREFESAQLQAKKKKSEPAPDVLTLLQRELELKNAQIEKQWEVIHSLNDRLREGNILMGSLQQRLALPMNPPATEITVESPITGASVEPVTHASREATEGSVKQDGTAQVIAKKKGLFRWFKR